MSFQGSEISVDEKCPSKGWKSASELMSNTSADHYPHTKFRHHSPYRTLDICLFLLLANRNKYAKELFDRRIWWWQTTWVTLVRCLPLPSYQVLWKSVIAFYLRFIFLLSRSDIHLYIVTYIQTAWQMKYNCRPTKRGYPSRLQSCILTSWSACLLQQFVLLPFIISLEGLLSLDVGAVKHGEIENMSIQGHELHLL